MAKVAGKDVANEIVPGPEDVVNEAREKEGESPLLRGLWENYGPF